jgi:hypothetical protein
VSNNNHARKGIPSKRGRAHSPMAYRPRPKLNNAPDPYRHDDVHFAPMTDHAAGWNGCGTGRAKVAHGLGIARGV